MASQLNSQQLSQLKAMALGTMNEQQISPPQVKTLKKRSIDDAASSEFLRDNPTDRDISGPSNPSTTIPTFPHSQPSSNRRVGRDSQSQLEYPSQIPDSQPKRMSFPGSEKGDTQPVSPSVYENIGQSGTEQDAQRISRPQLQNADIETQRTVLEGEEGHIDLLSMLDNPDDAVSEVSEAEEPVNPGLVSPTQPDPLESPEDARFLRPKTPAMSGRKRNYRGDFVDSTPINPLARNGTPAVGAMALSQVFMTSSPVPNIGITSDPLDTRPSPNFQPDGRASTIAPSSSPTKLPSSTRRTPGQPITTYRPMKESQEERERRKWEKRRQTKDDNSDSSDFDYFSSDQEERIDLSKRLQRIKGRENSEQNQAKRRKLSSPARSMSVQNRKRLHFSSSPRRSVGSSLTAAIVIPDDESDVRSDDRHSSEEETDKEGIDSDVPPGRSSKKDVLLTEENKENVRSSVVQVPVTVARHQAVNEPEQETESSPLLRKDSSRARGNSTVCGELTIPRSSGQDPATSANIASSPGVVIPNSQPSQYFPSLRCQRTTTEQGNGGVTAEVGKDGAGRNLGPPENYTSSVPASSPRQVSHVSNRYPESSQQASQHRELTDPRQGEKGDNVAIYDINTRNVSASNHPEDATSDDEEEEEQCERQPGYGSSKIEALFTTISDGHGNSVPQECDSSALKGMDLATSDTRTNNTPMPPPTLPASKPDISNTSSNYDTAQTQVTSHFSSDSARQTQQIEPQSILASPSGKKRARLTEVTKDLTPLNSFWDANVDFDELVGVDSEFHATVGDGSLSSPVRKRRRANNNMSIAVGQSEPKPHPSSPLSSLPRTPSPTSAFARNNNPFDKNDMSPRDRAEPQIRHSSRQSDAIWDVASQSPEKRPLPAKKLKHRGRRTSATGTSQPSTRPTDASQSLERALVSRAPKAREATPPMSSADFNPELPVDLDEVQQAHETRVVAPNMVFALFNGKTRAWYPATCIGPAAADQSCFLIKFEDTDLTEIDSSGVRRLELRIGDTIKISMEGIPKIPHVVRGFGQRVSNSQNVADEDPQVTDIFGHSTVTVAAKKRKSLPGASEMDTERTREVPISSIYLDNNMRAHFKERRFAFVNPSQFKAPAKESNGHLVSTPSTPSSRRGRYAAPDVEALPSTGLFSVMAFAVSYGNLEDKKQLLIKQITQHGGTVLSKGFNELFEQSSALLSSPTKKAIKDGDAGEDARLTLASAARNLSFAALITEKHSRREKYLQALALNIPCLSGRWISDCISRSAIVPWDAYLLPAGESKFLDGAVRSRVMTVYHPAGAKFAETIANRPKLLEGRNVLMTVGKGSRAEEKRKPFLFLTQALGARMVFKVPDVKAARVKIDEEDDYQVDWDWLYVDDHEENAARGLTEVGSTKGKNRKREPETKPLEDDDNGGVRKKKPKVMVNETIVQSLVLGQLFEE